MCFRNNDIQHKIFYLELAWLHNIYVSHLYSTVLQTVFLRYLVVSSSRNFIFKSFFSAGAVNAVSPANPFRKEKSNIFLTYILNSAFGSFSELPLIPKAQDAMTSVVYLYIVSTTSTGDPVNRPWWNCYYIFGLLHTHAFRRCNLFLGRVSWGCISVTECNFNMWQVHVFPFNCSEV